jgi:Flp pilus assembly protein TadD
MNRILTCPHCGPTLSEARLRCDRCGRELVYVSEAEFVGHEPGPEAGAEKPGIARRAGLWAGVAAAVVIVVATAGLTIPGRRTPATVLRDASTAMVAQPPAALSAAARATARSRAAETPENDVPVASHKPGDLGEALAHYRDALGEKPADPELMANVGQILVAMNKPAEAVPFLEQAVEAEPFAVVSRFDLAVAYSRSGKLKEAVEQYESLVRSGSADPRVHHNLALALRQLGRNAEATAAFERATALAPEQAPGWLGLALSLEMDGRGGEAAAALERYLSLEPSGPDADNVRARIARLRSVAEASAAPPEAGTATSRRRP